MKRHIRHSRGGECGIVIPAKAGIPEVLLALDPRLRGSDGLLILGALMKSSVKSHCCSSRVSQWRTLSISLEARAHHRRLRRGRSIRSRRAHGGAGADRTHGAAVRRRESARRDRHHRRRARRESAARRLHALSREPDHACRRAGDVRRRSATTRSGIS